MAMRVNLDWLGDRVNTAVRRAVEAGLEETANATLAIAIPKAPYRTGFLRASGFVESVRWEGERAVVTWGFSARYAAYQELGTRYIKPRWFIRDARLREYPRLAARIAARIH